MREPRQRSARAALWHPCYKPSSSYLYSLNIKNFEISGSQRGEYEDDAVSRLHGAISQKAVASFTIKVLCVYGQQKHTKVIQNKHNPNLRATDRDSPLTGNIKDCTSVAVRYTTVLVTSRDYKVQSVMLQSVFVMREFVNTR
jgi:hypothetical protein